MSIDADTSGLVVQQLRPTGRAIDPEERVCEDICRLGLQHLQRSNAATHADELLGLDGHDEAETDLGLQKLLACG